MDKSILQNWVTNVGLRHQGVLLSCVRGCDNVGKEDPSKAVVRALRGTFLRSFSTKPRSFIEVKIPDYELQERFALFLKDFDHLPVHYVTHLMFSAEIVGYKHPDLKTRIAWINFYLKLVHKLHLQPELENQLDSRLNAPEDRFFVQQDH